MNQSSEICFHGSIVAGFMHIRPTAASGVLIPPPLAQPAICLSIGKPCTPDILAMHQTLGCRRVPPRA